MADELLQFALFGTIAATSVSEICYQTLFINIKKNIIFEKFLRIRLFPQKVNTGLAKNKIQDHAKYLFSTEAVEAVACIIAHYII
jgi:hypothetical protein